jgi:hypothetical protein
LTAISASPFEFSYQKATPGGRSLHVLARSNSRPAAVSLPVGGSYPGQGIAEMIDIDDLAEVV